MISITFVLSSLSLPFQEESRATALLMTSLFFSCLPGSLLAMISFHFVCTSGASSAKYLWNT